MRRLPIVCVAILVGGSRGFAQAPNPAEPPPPEPKPAPVIPEPSPAPQQPQPEALVPAPMPKQPATTAASREQQLEAQQVCNSHDPRCDWMQTLSSLERQSVSRAIEARGYVIDPAPWGKVIAKVHVYNEDVLAEANWLRFFNHFHVTTREPAIVSELTIGAGDVWDDDKVLESARRLHDPLFSSVVATLPVVSSEPGKVNLLVVTRDIWSLRLNSQYTFQQGSLTNLSMSISENNFLGERDLVAMAMTMDQAALAVGPLFIDKNVLGTHLVLSARVDDILSRRAPLAFDPTTAGFIPVPGDPEGLQDASQFHSEGHDATVSLALPLWALASEWGGGVAYSYRNAVIRSFSGAAPDPTSFPNVGGNPNALYLDPGTMLPYEYRLLTESVNPYAQRQWGTAIKSQLTIGYVLSKQRPSLLPSFAGDAEQRVMFAADVFPHSEVISQPYIDYTFFQPRYHTVRNIQTYELAEDLQTGLSADVSLGEGLALLGSDHTFERPAASVGYTIPWCDEGFVRPSVAASLRIQTDGTTPNNWSTIDNTATALIRAATPTIHYLRVIGQVELDTRWHDTQNAFYVIGSDTGLRGYDVNEFELIGSGRRLSGLFEARSVPVPLWVFRLGGVAFYEFGGVADSLRDMKVYQDVGFGVRALIPQLSRILFRFDLAFPLIEVPGNSPVHFIAGFDSYF